MKTNHVQSATGLPPVSTLSAPMHARLISKTENEFRTRDNTKDNATAKVTTRNKWPRIIVTKHGKRMVVLLFFSFFNRLYSLLSSWLAPTVNLEALPFTYSVCCYG